MHRDVTDLWFIATWSNDHWKGQAESGEWMLKQVAVLREPSQ